MTLRLTHLHVAATAAAVAVATVSLAGTPARAFTLETVSPSANGSNFADPDDQVKNFGRGYQFGSGGPVVQFGAQSQPQPFGRFGPGAGFAPTPTPPEPYARPPGNGD